MKSFEFIPLLKKQIHQKFVEAFQEQDGPMSELKSDRTIVTEIDLFVSALIKKELLNIDEFSHFNFFSEEDYGEYKFPAIILDPIDGTGPLSRGVPECAVSLAIMPTSEIKGMAWIYNPFTGFEVGSDEIFFPPPGRSQRPPFGLVSSNEWRKGLFKSTEGGPVSLAPRGSIAFKLGLLASGACDFVITKEPKHVWDIAAGSILCRQRGLRLYTKEGELTSLEEVNLTPPLLWCHEKDRPTLEKELEL